jgi:hypothetical protein
VPVSPSQNGDDVFYCKTPTCPKSSGGRTYARTSAGVGLDGLAIPRKDAHYIMWRILQPTSRCPDIPAGMLPSQNPSSLLMEWPPAFPTRPSRVSRTEKSQRRNPTRS